jgi:hypothetical protein
MTARTTVRWIKAKLRKQRANLYPKFMASVPQAIESNIILKPAAPQAGSAEAIGSMAAMVNGG